MSVLFNIFMRQRLTDDFWVLHRYMNCIFPLKFVWSENITYELNQNVLIAEKEAATRGVI